jgi:two-component system, OmpR family, sensor histidine kinase ChvG
MVAEIDKPQLTASSRAHREDSLGVPAARLVTRVRRFVSRYIFSSLTRRILFLNLAGLGILVSGIFYLTQFREGLIDARVESLMTQGQIIAGAIASAATVETDSIRIDPEKLLELQAGQSLSPRTDSLESLEFPINPEKVAPLLRQIISPTRTRARIYDRDANLLLDSRHLYSRGQILRFDLPPIEDDDETIFERASKWLASFFRRSDLPVYQEQPGGSGAAYPEVMTALTGGPATVVRLSEQGEMIVSVAIPIQRFRAVLGVLMLSTQGGDIDKIVAAERQGILRIFAIASLVTILLSILLASTIANPLRRLAAAAIRVRRSIKVREEIPDFSDRPDEIGSLSSALRDMTKALYARIDAIESFAADVAHELKNPLTSLRSATETLPLARNEESRKRLMDVIQHDVRRLDRLISDISDASRLDAELAREDASPVDLRRLLTEVIAITNDSARRANKVAIRLDIPKDMAKERYVVSGHELRLGQVFINLIENARSFVPGEGGQIVFGLSRRGSRIFVVVEDNGPGIRAENIEKIFSRFYTDRPSGEAFGQNSGLGLSISRQIVEAHGGTITAENITAKGGSESWAGARFIISLPVEGTWTR